MQNLTRGYRDRRGAPPPPQPGAPLAEPPPPPHARTPLRVFSPGPCTPLQ